MDLPSTISLTSLANSPPPSPRPPIPPSPAALHHPVCLALAPTRSRRYFKTLDLLCDLLPADIYDAPASLVHAILSLVDPALASYGREVARFALGVLYAIVGEHSKRVRVLAITAGTDSIRPCCRCPCRCCCHH